MACGVFLPICSSWGSGGGFDLQPAFVCAEFIFVWLPEPLILLKKNSFYWLRSQRLVSVVQVNEITASSLHST